MKPRISTGALHHSRALSPESMGDAQVTHHISRSEAGAAMKSVAAYMAKHPELRYGLGGKVRKSQSTK